MYIDTYVSQCKGQSYQEELASSESSVWHDYLVLNDQLTLLPISDWKDITPLIGKR